jgi:hypothetical protein
MPWVIWPGIDPGTLALEAVKFAFGAWPLRIPDSNGATARCGKGNAAVHSSLKILA